ncbi:MAG: RNA methyltransferase [Chloroflexi bacterium]|nr:RNA methyltransferase [Chloroflexota bacterium]
MTPAKAARESSNYEAEVIPGIEPFALDELRAKCARQTIRPTRARPGFVRFAFSGPPTELNALRSVIAIYRVHTFDIPRPKALLGHQHFARLVTALADIMRLFPRAPQTLGIGAAGSESSVLRRLRRELAQALKLEESKDKGELFIRLAPDSHKTCWEVLARTTLMPLAKRAYRVDDVPGSLNATVAYALTQVKPLRGRSTVVNLCSGASTILIEHALQRPQDRLIAIDNSAAVIAAARRNGAASGTGLSISQLRADATNTPLPPHMADQLYADLPFGNLVGSHAENKLLYPDILREAARLARPAAGFIVLTHEIKLMRESLPASPWVLINETKINLRGLHPRIFVLERNSTRIVGDFAADR